MSTKTQSALRATLKQEDAALKERLPEATVPAAPPPETAAPAVAAAPAAAADASAQAAEGIRLLEAGRYDDAARAFIAARRLALPVIMLERE